MKPQKRSRILQAVCTLSLISLAPPAAHAITAAETSLEHLSSDAFSISLLTIRANDQLGPWDAQTTLSATDYSLDFQAASFDFLGYDTQIDEKTYSLGIAASRPIQDALAIELGAALRDGFPNYRAAWLDTYFDQHFAPLEGVPGHELYQDFDASAASLNAGLRWDYRPANAIATLSFSRIQDRVSPGYEIDFDGIQRGERVLASSSISLVTENVLNQNLRSRFAITATETSARETRYGAELALNAALGDRFILRAKAGASTEAPTFDAYFLDLALEYQASEKLALYLNARTYRDTGEIENALLFTTAAPGLDNDTIGLGLRYTSENWTARLSAARSQSDFEDTNKDADFFQHLYADSDWLTLQIALGKTF